MQNLLWEQAWIVMITSLWLLDAYTLFWSLLQQSFACSRIPGFDKQELIVAQTVSFMYRLFYPHMQCL